MRAFVVLGFVFPYLAKRLAWRMSPKWPPISCRVGRKTPTQSVSLTDHEHCQVASTRSSGQPLQRRPVDRTSNSVVARYGKSWWQLADRRWCRQVMVIFISPYNG